MSGGHVEPGEHPEVTVHHNMKLEFDPQEFYRVQWFELNTLPLERTDPHLERFARQLARLGIEPASVLERPDIVTQALESFEPSSSVGFSDYLILAGASAVGQGPLESFDQKFGKLVSVEKL